MISEVSISLFTVSKCGYYKADTMNNAGVASEFGDLEQTIRNIEKWAHGKKIHQTATYDVPEDSELRKTFFVGIYPQNDDFLICLWNQIIETGKKVASVGMDDVVGDVHTKFTEIDPNRIPGYPTYFYVMPREGKIATVRFGHKSNGMDNFKKYVYEFLKVICPDHVVHHVPEGDEAVKIGRVVRGYRKDVTKEVVQNIFPRLKIDTIRKAGDLEKIRKNSANIRQIVSKTTISSDVPVDRNFWQVIANMLGGEIQNRRIVDEMNIKIEVPLVVSEDEANSLIDVWEARLQNTDSSWEDLGFRLSGESTPLWIGKSHARKKFHIDLHWINEELVSPDNLKSELHRMRREILGLEH